MKKVILNVVLTIVATIIIGTLFYIGYQESQGNTGKFDYETDVEYNNPCNLPTNTEPTTKEEPTNENTTDAPVNKPTSDGGWQEEDSYAQMNAGDYLISESDGVITFVKYTGKDTKVTLPTEYKGKPITHIAEGAFTSSECEAVYIPSSYERICRGAFADNVTIKEVFIGEKVVEVESMAFGYCRNLKTVKGCQNVKYVSSYAFTGCKSLESVDFDFRNIEVGEKAFDGTNIKV